MHQPTKYPLLIQGFSSIHPTPGTAGFATQTNTFTKGRGNIRYMDIIPRDKGGANDYASDILTVSVGGQVIINEMSAQPFLYACGAFLHNYIQCDLGPGQTYTFSANTAFNSLNLDQEFCLHAYYENHFDTPEMREKLRAVFKTLQRQAFSVEGFASGRISSQSFTIPQDQGDVCAIQLVYEGSPNDDINLFFNRVSLQVNNTTVIDNANALLFSPQCTRKGLILPIKIERESTVVLSWDDTATSGTNNRLRLICYFDDQFKR